MRREPKEKVGYVVVVVVVSGVEFIETVRERKVLCRQKWRESRRPCRVFLPSVLSVTQENPRCCGIFGSKWRWPVSPS